MDTLQDLAPLVPIGQGGMDADPRMHPEDYNGGTPMDPSSQSQGPPAQENTTQLADAFPQMDTPLRIDPPASVKVPERIEAQGKDAHVRAVAFSPKAHVGQRRLVAGLDAASARITEDAPQGVGSGHKGRIASTYARVSASKGFDFVGNCDIEGTAQSTKALSSSLRRTLAQAQSGATGHKRVAVENRVLKHSVALGAQYNTVSDRGMLAFSSQRSGKVDTEAGALLGIAITHDNMKRYHQAINTYTKFIALCRKSTQMSVLFEGLAHNCIGVDYMMIAMPSGVTYAASMGGVGGVEGGVKQEQGGERGQHAVDMLNKAVEHHKSHLSVADEGGAFVACTNLGLCYSALGDQKSSTDYHQQALRIAIKLQSFSGQSIAVGNLGLIATHQGELKTAQACLEQHLQLTQSLNDPEAEINAWTLLGSVFRRQQSYDDAVDAFSNASEVAEGQFDIGVMKRLSCEIGIARHEQEAESFMRAKIAELEAKEPTPPSV